MTQTILEGDPNWTYTGVPLTIVGFVSAYPADACIVVMATEVDE